MTEEPTEARAVFPLVVFNRPRLGQTAGQKEGIIPLDPISTLPPEKVIDFRPKVVSADVFVETLTDLVESKALAGDDPAGEGADPKDVTSSATDSVTPSEGDSSESTTPPTQMPASPTSPSFQSEFLATNADAEKAAHGMIGALQARTIGVSTPPAETTGEAPSGS